MTEFALRPATAGPRSGSDLCFPNDLRSPFGEDHAVPERILAEHPPGSAADGEHRRLSRPTGPHASGGNPKTPGRPARGPLAPGARHADEEATR